MTIADALISSVSQVAGAAKAPVGAKPDSRPCL